MKNILKKYFASKYSLLLTAFVFITFHSISQSCLLSDCELKNILRPIYFHFTQPMGAYFLYGILGYVISSLFFEKFPKKFALLWTVISIFLILITDTDSKYFLPIFIKYHVALWLGSLFSILAFIIMLFMLFIKKK